MSAKRTNKERIFSAAVELETDQRLAFLGAACGNDDQFLLLLADDPFGLKHDKPLCATRQHDGCSGQHQGGCQTAKTTITTH